MRLFRFGLWMMLPLALAACGGGGGGGCLLGGAVACSAPAPANVAPVARVTPSQDVVTGSTVTLDATGSTDANQDVLTYGWTLLSRPAGSQAVLSSDTAAKPTFTADVSGTYVLALTVYDGKAYSTPAAATVQATVANVAPVANAGTNQSVVVGTQVTLDGTMSSDANLGDVLTYSWTLSRPDGSLASLSSATSVRPSFTADVAGTYLATLMVSDGRLYSGLSSVRAVASAVNAAPVANAGGNRTALVGETVVLDGGGSTDANPGDVLRYAWQLVSSPTTTPASTAKLSPASNPAGTASTNKTVSITPDQPGTYVVALVVNDGTDSSDTALVTITVRAVNQAPVAVITGAAGTTVSAGTATGTVGTVMTFDGRSSTDDGPAQLLTYRWRLELKPAASTLQITEPNLAVITLRPDQPGQYVLRLQVDDGSLRSADVPLVIVVNP